MGLHKPRDTTMVVVIVAPYAYLPTA
jgi:hypothetical protein